REPVAGRGAGEEMRGHLLLQLPGELAHEHLDGTDLVLFFLHVADGRCAEGTHVLVLVPLLRIPPLDEGENDRDLRPTRVRTEDLVDWPESDDVQSYHQTPRRSSPRSGSTCRRRSSTLSRQTRACLPTRG